MNRPSVTRRYCIKTAKCRIAQTTPYVGSHLAESFRFSELVIIAELYGLKSQDLEMFWAIFAIFGKTTPYGKIFKILFRLVDRKIRPTGNRWNRALFTSQKSKFRLSLKMSLRRGSRPKSARSAPNIWLTVFQISPKSVYFRRSYSRTLEAVFWPIEYCNIRLQANNNTNCQFSSISAGDENVP